MSAGTWANVWDLERSVACSIVDAREQSDSARINRPGAAFSEVLRDSFLKKFEDDGGAGLWIFSSLLKPPSFENEEFDEEESNAARVFLTRKRSRGEESVTSDTANSPRTARTGGSAMAESPESLSPRSQRLFRSAGGAFSGPPLLPVPAAVSHVLPTLANFNDRKHRETTKVVNPSEHGGSGEDDRDESFWPDLFKLGTVEGFCGKPIVQQLEGLKASFVIRLYPYGFALDSSQRELLSYESPAFVDILRAIDTGRLTTDLLGLVHSTPCHFYDGCLIVELRDYRRSMFYANPPVLRSGQRQSGAPAGRLPRPEIRRVLLRPDHDCVVNDVATLVAELLGGDVPENDLLQLEGRILRSIQPALCLDPSPQVAQLSNFLQHNRLKFSFRPRSKRRRLNPHMLHAKFVSPTTPLSPLLPPTAAEGADAVGQPTALRLGKIVPVGAGIVKPTALVPSGARGGMAAPLHLASGGHGGDITAASSEEMASWPRLLRFLVQHGWQDSSQRSSFARRAEVVSARSAASAPHASHLKIQLATAVLPTQLIHQRRLTAVPYREYSVSIDLRSAERGSYMNLEIRGASGLFSFVREETRSALRSGLVVEQPSRLYFQLPSYRLVEQLPRAFRLVSDREKFEPDPKSQREAIAPAKPPAATATATGSSARQPQALQNASAAPVRPLVAAEPVSATPTNSRGGKVVQPGGALPQVQGVPKVPVVPRATQLPAVPMALPQLPPGSAALHQSIQAEFFNRQYANFLKTMSPQQANLAAMAQLRAAQLGYAQLMSGRPAAPASPGSGGLPRHDSAL